MAEAERKPYALYDKDGNFITYRMTKRIKNEQGEYDVLTARSKKSVKECRRRLDEKIAEYFKEQEERKHRGMFPDMKFGKFADNWYTLTIKDANCSKINKDNYRGCVYTHIIPYFGDFKLCDITEDDCQRFLNGYKGRSKVFVMKLRMTLRRIFRKAKKQPFSA